MTKDIYLIDDDEMVHFLLKYKLQKEGYNFHAFTTAEEFEKLLSDPTKDFRNAILLMDINLPNEDGDLFVQRSKERINGFDGLRIIFLTDNKDNLRIDKEIYHRTESSTKENVTSLILENEVAS